MEILIIPEAWIPVKYHYSSNTMKCDIWYKRCWMHADPIGFSGSVVIVGSSNISVLLCPAAYPRPVSTLCWD